MSKDVTLRQDNRSLITYLFKHKRSQREFARACGLGIQSLCSIVKGKRTPGLSSALRIYMESKGEVSILTLLPQAEREFLEKKYREFLENQGYFES